MNRSIRGCIDCAHYNRELPECLEGNNDEMHKWWIANGSKTRMDINTELSCFTKTKHAEMLDGLIEATKNLSVKLQNIKEQE